MKPLPVPEQARVVLRSLMSDGESPSMTEGTTAADHRIEQLEVFAGWLAGPGIDRGLLGPREADRIWPRHVVNSALLLPLVGTPESVCDLGSGAGLPGVVLAVLRPDLSVTLLEPLLRRSEFLIELVRALGLGRVSVVRARAEEYAALQPDHDLVVARAVAPLPRLAGWALPLLRPGGELLAMKGEHATTELGDAQPTLDLLGAGDREVCTLSAGGNVTHAVRVVRPAPQGDSQSRQRTEDR